MVGRLDPARFGRRDYLILETCLNYSEMYELPCPSRQDFRSFPPAVLVERFWWRLGVVSDRFKSYIERNPQALPDWNERFPCEDRRDCMSAICGTLAGRFPGQRETCLQIMLISAGVFSTSLARWRAETEDYRWMMAHLAGDLKHRALRDLVLGHRYVNRDQDGQR